MIRFVVLAFGRSGSTMLVNYLCGHRRAICYHEPFNQSWPYRPTETLEDVASVIDEVYDPGLDMAPTAPHRAGLLARLGLGCRPRERDVRGERQRPHRGKLDAVGFKVTVGQALHHRPWILQVLGERPDVRVVLLRRRDLLRRYVSYEQARARNLWHSTSPEAAAVAPIRVEFEAFRRFVDAYEDEDRRISEALLARPRRSVDIAYEDLVARRDEVMRDVFGLLELDPPSRYDARTVQLISGALPDLVANFDELEAASRGTAYARWISSDAESE